MHFLVESHYACYCCARYMAHNKMEASLKCSECDYLYQARPIREDDGRVVDRRPVFSRTCCHTAYCMDCFSSMLLDKEEHQRTQWFDCPLCPQNANPSNQPSFYRSNYFANETFCLFLEATQSNRSAQELIQRSRQGQSVPHVKEETDSSDSEVEVVEDPRPSKKRRVQARTVSTPPNVRNGTSPQQTNSDTDAHPVSPDATSSIVVPANRIIAPRSSGEVQNVTPVRARSTTGLRSVPLELTQQEVMTPPGRAGSNEIIRSTDRRRSDTAQIQSGAPRVSTHEVTPLKQENESESAPLKSEDNIGLNSTVENHPGDNFVDLTADTEAPPPPPSFTKEAFMTRQIFHVNPFLNSAKGKNRGFDIFIAAKGVSIGFFGSSPDFFTNGMLVFRLKRFSVGSRMRMGGRKRMRPKSACGIPKSKKETLSS